MLLADLDYAFGRRIERGRMFRRSKDAVVLGPTQAELA